ncbi:DUF7537 family lipoprotein [Halorubrum lacusprofundi]|jgi:hypothetical protein|uniref:Lipoprotein n=1 Tax=Halorubrum lacusprofundi (strain ATCC 49239 / DSM 5036 / JCM 8891 / ACAM 34) TaxID=416348 RepID=B9LQV6_HALLT|nr:hypothetical protein [Halorubrum lacusprofundi]ACM55708.1 hypothetical protein Hlac_0102 [Halorubrum lacusprofundi ATCC 49239]MCG1007177.1 hypothetical protein [Halorubrum lacusprofundi]
MDRRRFFIGVGTGVAVGSAGCLGGEPDRPFPDADWRDEDGLDVATLSERHVEALVDAGGITLFSTAETTHDGDTEPSPWLPSQEYESAYDLENGRQYVRQELTETEETDVSELYVADGEALVRQRIGDETQYGRQSVDRSADDLESAMRSEVVTGIRVEGQTAGGETEYEGLNLWNPTSDGEGEVRGEPTAKFTADAFEGDRNIPETVETASATVHVYEFGVVPRLKQSWAGEHEGQEATVDVDIDYRDPGVTVAEPDWAEEAREETSA